MGVKVITWDDGRTKAEIQKRFRNAAEARRPFEQRWLQNERTVFATTGRALDAASLNAFMEGSSDTASDGGADVNVSYAFKNLRYIHAQMSANPPSVAMRPQTSDQDDHRKADAADRTSRWALRHFQLQEKQDQQNLLTLIYGTGPRKAVWDSTRGDIIAYDPEAEEVELEGDIEITTPTVWNIYLDPDAKSRDELKYVFEVIYIDYEEACARWPEHEDLLKKSLKERSSTSGRSESSNNSLLEDKHYNSVQLLEYWETGLPTNGYLGRYCITTMEGDPLEKCRPSPFRFRRAGAVSRIESSDAPDEIKEQLIARLPEQARLPYNFLTDIDVPNQIWGKSSIEYASALQLNLSRLDSAKLENIQAHGVARMIVPESADVSDDSLSNSPWDICKITGNQPPYFMAPPQLMPDMTSERVNYINGINDVMGVNESMFGQQSREQSGASMQYATNQGNMVRRRLFNKYVNSVEALFMDILCLIRKHWSIARTIHVIGKEKALEAIDLKGADIDGGYDIVGEYGVTLSLDPITRREEILQLQPLFEKAGVPPRTAMRMLKLNELESMFDELDLAESRQKEIFDLMIAGQGYIPPRKFRDHENMIAFALHYFMTQEFESLPLETQMLLERHIEERAALAAQEKSGNASPPGAPGGAPGVPPPAGPPAGPPIGPTGAPDNTAGAAPQPADAAGPVAA